MFNEDIGTFLDFLTELYNDGLRYSAINTARSAVSSVVICRKRGHTIGAHPLTSKFKKGIFVLRAPSVRYKTMWDVNIVLRWIQKQSPVQKISLKMLTLKLVMLIALTTACRGDTLSKLSLEHIREGKSSFQFFVTMKQSRIGYKTPLILLNAYPVDRRLCVYTVLKEYLRRTLKLRGDVNSLFITTVKPHKKAAKATIARWIKTVMTASGIDTSIFKPHSTRSASASKAWMSGIALDHILDTAGWTQENTFSKYYKKEIITEGNGFDTGVLQ